MIREKEHIVVVTAAAPFKDNETNPTQAVKNKLPDYIKREGRIPIKIIKYHTDFRNVLTDMDLIPPLWSGEKSVFDPDCKRGQKISIDAILHMGMTFGDTWWVEKRAPRDGYKWVGDDGLPLPAENGEKGERWAGLPGELFTAFDVDDVVKHVQSQLPDVPVKASTTPGFEYCAFIYYTSLATLYRQQDVARTVFLHHAGQRTDENGLEEGAQVAASVICSMIDQIEAHLAVE